MTREEREKAIDALKISAPVMAVTQEEFNDYIQTLNKIMDWLEQEPCEDCVSRQDACSSRICRGIDCIDCPFNKFFPDGTTTCLMAERIKELPSVTPQYTDTEIQKMQDLEFAEIQKGYEIGKDEGSEVLNKIRAEIVHSHDWAFSRETILRIIDKYKASPTAAESEE